MGKAEAVMQTEIINAMTEAGYFAWRMYTGPIIRGGGRKGPNPAKGMPDVVALKDGVFYCIEVKGPQGQVAPHQKEWLEKASKYGAKSYIVRDAHEFLVSIGVYKETITQSPLEVLFGEER